MKFTENQLKLFAAPLSTTEDKQCLNAISMVRDALKQLGFTDDNKAISKMYDDTYAYSIQMRSLQSSRQIKIFVQGSYANNTNVRTQSDVDIAIVQEETFQTEYRPGVTDANYNFFIVPIAPKTFKDEVQNCLEYKFGQDVERKNKSIKIHGNTYRKDADTVPCQRLRNYTNEFYNNAANYIGGIVIKADDGSRIINYPEQHIENGKNKNNDTNYYYKKMVRIAKNIRYLMEESHFPSAKDISSFGLESLLWNIPNREYMQFSSYRFIFSDIVDFLYENISLVASYKEANGIKQLCSTSRDIERYTALIKDLKSFYQYDIEE